ncbi:hypothetical protein [Streptomyces niveus]|uniref:hypothetical protein n=1 Tax=Streptomyces niveus TaxID=193462 RepID=UPI003418D1EB
MARTAHHRPLSRAEAAPGWRRWRSVRLYDLRYSARAVADTPGPGVLALAEADAVDVLPARHRRCALWLG